MPNYEDVAPWYSQKDKIQKVVIENGVTNIGDYAFLDCSGITFVTIPNSVTSIGQDAFYGCSGLTSVTIPNSVTSIGGGAFYGCSGLTSVTIPNSVTSIGGGAFYGCRCLTSVTIPNSVTSIEASAFSKCTSLTSITIPNSVTNIGASAFSKCTSLTSITIPNSVTNIGVSAFSACSGLNSIIVDKGNKTYDSRNNCNAIIHTATNVLIQGCYNTVIPNSVTSIESSAFYGCKKLTSITIPNSVTSIRNAAFSGCTGLTSIVIPNSVTSIEGSAFYGCKKLASITIPNSVTSIEKSVFYGCTGLTSITIPNSVTSIEENAFYNCTGLTSITIGNSLTSIGNDAFLYCYSLNKINNNSSLSLSKGSSRNGYIAYYAHFIYNNVSIDGDYRTYKDNNGNSWLCDYVGIDKIVTLPNNIYGIAKHAFEGHSNITSVIIPNSVKSIEDNAFYGCKLQTLIIGADVTSIGSNVFKNASKPNKVIWLPNTPPSGYKNVSGVINYVSNDNYADLPNTKVYKHLSSMFEVDGIKYVPVSPSERTCDVIDCNYDETAENIKICDVVSYKNIGMKVLNINPYTCYGNEYIKTLNINNSGNIDERAFKGCKNITSVSFGNKITSIGDYAFSDCTGIKEIEITNLVTSIGDNSFNGCKLLKKVVLVDCPATIGTNAFENCSALTELNLGKKIKAIGSYAFKNCSSLSKISIPKTTTSIGEYAFSGCKSLADVTIENRKESIALGSNGSSPLFADCPISSVYLGGKLFYKSSSDYGYSPFYRNKNLQSVVVADAEEQIYDNEFYGCTNLKSVKIGDGVKSIGKWAFSGCASLESFSFGKSMQSIGQEAFSDCTNMKSITSYAATAPVCGSQALDDIDKWSCVLSVPYSSLASYQNAAQWKEFFFIQETEPDEQTIANAVIAKINAIGKVEYTDACKAKIDDASSAYNALTDDQKALVTNLDVLTTAKQTYETLKAAAEKLAADKAAANKVVNKIKAIGTVEYTEACKNKIDAASKAYEALTDDQKALVTNLDVLTTAKQTYETLKAAAEKLAADKAAANKVVNKIKAIGTVEYTDACKSKIDAASKAYEALTDDQKALVTNLDVLTTAKQTYETLKAAAEKLAADKAAFDKYKSEIIAIIESLVKEDDSDAVKEIINKAISDINALGYEEAISLDDNKAKINSFVTSVNEAVEKQRTDDQKTNGIEELELAEKVNIYDLNGRKITNSMLKSGLYIKNGKKIVVK